jgi:hypothetical protein
MSQKTTVRNVVSALGERHARSVDEQGKVIPRCNQYRGTGRQADMVVTANVKRVNCERCKGLVQ